MLIYLLFIISIFINLNAFYEEGWWKKPGNPEELKKFAQTGECKKCNLNGFDLRNIIHELRKDSPYQPIDLEDAWLYEANFSDANLEQANLSNARMVRTNLENANLKRAFLQKAFLLAANLRNANCSNVAAQDACFQDAKAQHANFNHADLENVSFSGANVSNSRFKHSNMRNVRFHGTKAHDANFKKADLTQAIFNARTDLENADFTSAVCRETRFIGCILLGALFFNTLLNDTKFISSRFQPEQNVDPNNGWRYE